MKKYFLRDLCTFNAKKGADDRQKTIYGFKAHINADEDGFILAETLTTGKVHDSQVFEELLTGEEAAEYADSAYKSKAHDEDWKRKKHKMGIKRNQARLTISCIAYNLKRAVSILRVSA